MASQQEQLKQVLRQAGLRVTPARVAVLAALKRHTKPIDAYTVMAKLTGIRPDQVTVYRVLNMLVQAALVREVYVAKGVSSYELADRPHHHHLICERCGFVEDVKTCCDAPRPVDTSFRVVTRHNLEFMGVCEHCAASG